ncbi:putative peptidoglycan glycosyltransferase FtsW [Blautia sp.]|uniref:FtsW/RodA/SpoVE family cell cycle protein n=1 Tax=uncultured Blautia sp. TaxID=765821 RepID=UPI00280BF52A|nr:putative peptidoglycan glycosyltransferase FtsW [Blautia sp.]MDY3017904.1 putative peptidoglycan glycosyltransferase FtsW [Blautia sp.]MED9882763.1 putative peptidoglycan glycosyltransferase FtsW [Blautia sp.]
MAEQKKRKKKPVSRKKADYYDYSLLAVVILLTCFGLIMLYSTSAYMAEVRYGDDMYFFKKQAFISAGCIVVMILISKIDYHILTKFVTVLYGAAFILMALVRFTPLGVVVNGAKRWLKIGIQFQPSEIAKIAVIVCLPYMIIKMGRQVQTLKACMILGLAGLVLAGGAYVFTDNLSTAIIIFGITAGLIFVSHPKVKPFLLIGAVGVVLILGLVLFLYATVDPETNENFRIGRILVWLHPEDFADGDGYQTLQALYAIGSGGFLGRGLGNSIQKLGSVPEAQNDMIFSIVCEELGIAGGIMVLLLFSYLLYRLFFIAQNAPDMFGSLMVSGVFIHISLQVIFNIAVVVNMMPNTGVTLPFISYGGTSIMFLMAEMGLALSVARQIRFQDV